MSELKRTLIAFVFTFGFLCFGFLCFVFIPHSIIGNHGIPFFRPLWISDFPPESRMHMAKYLVANHSLRGLKDTEVRELLGFGQYPNEYEADSGPSTILVCPIHHGLSGATFYVTIEDGKVIDEKLSEGD